MDAMYSAIKGRRGGAGLMDDPQEEMDEVPAPPQKGGGMNMQSLVSALSDDQKSQLLSLLVAGDKGQSPAPKDPMAIEKGGMGPGEESEIEDSLGDGHESEDDLAESMISSSDKMRSANGDKPRNLSERMKFDLASKLKNKGK